MGERHFQPVGKMVTEEGATFDPAQEYDLSVDARLVVHDYNVSQYVLAQVIPHGKTYVVPRDFFKHENYKWKLQRREGASWVDHVKYTGFFFPEI